MRNPIRRRDFVMLLGGAPAWPLAARAQQPAMPVVGVLNGQSAAEWVEPMKAFQRGLAEMGFVGGRNVTIEYRWAEGRYERLPAMAAELVSRKVAAIHAGGNIDATRFAMAATKTIPIVFTTGADPVAEGLVASLNRPGGNVTGHTFLGHEVTAKKFELLHDMIPAVTRIAVLVNPHNAATKNDALDAARTASHRLGLAFVVVEASTESEIEDAFAAAVRQRAGAIICVDAYFAARREQIAALGLRFAMPTIGSGRPAVAAGYLMDYGASFSDIYRQAGVYVGRILKGEKPGDLPVMQPTKFELVVNLKTAKAIGLTIPETFLVRADEVIE
jgi:putative tryptophan/tyrosine transport system substrate-binding protein